MRMEVHTLYYAIEEILSIEYKNRHWRLVLYLSKSLNETEINYEIHNKKMLAVIRELENWNYLLEDTKFKFEIWIDYKNLYFKTCTRNKDKKGR